MNKTIIDRAKDHKWGPTVYEPRNPLDAVNYALECLGNRARLCSLGEVYGIKSLLWLKDKLEAETKGEPK